MPLAYVESRALERRSVDRLPATVSSGTDWDAATFASRVWWGDERARIAATLLAEAVSASRQVALLRGDLTVATVVLAAETVVAHAEELLNMGTLFWLVTPVPEPTKTSL
ncbi:hypothetical protein ACIQVO_09520 [Streptomyces sp. NPDC101062]|uniref:hypothetical protein n=1 Tax=unclassified Streptomyces TaxID=2593676 RepID=UPI0038045020